MYVVAQRVISPAGQSGVNAFLFLHGGQKIPGMSWNDPDVEVIADTHPGTLVLQRVEQPSGGNDVVSYLDIVAPDSLGIEHLGRILLESPPPPASTATWSRGPIAIRFLSQSPSNHVSEFDELRKHAVLLLLRPDNASPASAQGQPIRILAQDMAGVGMAYQLDPDSSVRLIEHGVLTSAARLHVAYEDMEELKRIWGEGEYHAQIALSLTGVSQDALRRAGGYEIRHVPGTGTAVADPMEPSMVATTRDIPGQIDGDWLGPQSVPVSERAGWPTGALLRSNDGTRALDLVFVESAWFPISEAALYTYQHSAGLQGGERWRFVARGSNEAFEVTIGPPLTRQEVADQYGREASVRSRSDYKTVQLLLKRLPSI